jgi:hypothetical protein
MWAPMQEIGGKCVPETSNLLAYVWMHMEVVRHSLGLLCPLTLFPTQS